VLFVAKLGGVAREGVEIRRSAVWNEALAGHLDQVDDPLARRPGGPELGREFEDDQLLDLVGPEGAPAVEEVGTAITKHRYADFRLRARGVEMKDRCEDTIIGQVLHDVLAIPELLLSVVSSYGSHWNRAIGWQADDVFAVDDQLDPRCQASLNEFAGV